MSGWTRCCTSWLSWDVIYIYICYPPSQNPCFALFSEGCLKQPWECACKSSKQKADVFFESCMQEHWGCACKSSKQKADACCSFTFTLSLKVYDEQNCVCARIRTSQETMNLVTTKDNWMSLSMCENPHVPGNYEPGDDRRQHETSLDILLHMAGNIVSRVHIWARPQWMSLREATDSGIDWYLLVLDQASLQRSAGKKVELFHLAQQKAAFGHSLRLVVRHGRGHEIAFGWKGWSCRGWVLLLLLLLRCEVSEQLCLDILYIWLWDMGEGIE